MPGLGQGISARLSEDRIEQIVQDHSDLGTFASIFANNKDLELLSLPRDYKDIDTNIKRDWWERDTLKDLIGVSLRSWMILLKI